MKILIFTFILLSLVMVAHAQYSKKQLEDLISNGSSRDWQLADYKKTLGNECQGKGQLLTFFKNGKVQVKKCVNNKVVFQEFNWTLKPLGNPAKLEWTIDLSAPVTIDDQFQVTKMRIDLPLAEKKKANKKMVWREFPDCKACPQQNVTLLSKN